MRYALAALVVFGGVAHADEKLIPTAIAVSSTVDNARILPAHLVDGKLTTAWNSVTFDKSPWIAIRVPAAARVAIFKMTAGFTAIDKKLGDLFTKNHRIKHVTVYRNGARLGDFPLDIDSRELQTLKIDAAGGDFKIAIDATVPGTRKNWQEVAVSELEVWGTPDPAAKPPAKPVPPPVSLGSLDNFPALTKAECARLLGAATAQTVGHAEIGITSTLTLCRRDLQEKGTITANVQLALVDRRTQAVLTQLPDITIANGDYTDSFEYGNCARGCNATGSVDLEYVPLTTAETVIAVTLAKGESTSHSGASDKTTTWYRASRKGLVQVLAYVSQSYGDEHDSSGSRCEMQPFVPVATVPKLLTVECQEWKEGIYEQHPFDNTRQQRFKWNGTVYVKR
ncbi:MAG: hypothetical protein M3680_31705 [Myxococcota bacterium]|nr:hypothetical protein [Myxococcota bacterium]